MIALAVGSSACGGGEKTGGETAAGNTLTIYSSFPLQGDSRPQSQAMVNGIRMAMQEAGGRAGKFRIKYVSLDDSTATTGKWDAGQTSADARKAAQDKSTIAYLGESNSGATVVSLPILNQAGILQISPDNTYVGLTRSEGAAKGEPDKYYPTGKRTYGRVMPPDNVDATAQVTYQKEQGCTKLYVLNDKEVYGKGLADLVARIAPQQGLKVLGNDGIDVKAANFRSLAAKIKTAGADCMFYGGIAENKGVELWTDVHAANPDMKLFGPVGMAETPFTSKISASAQAKTYLTTPTIDPAKYPPAGRAFLRRYKQKYGTQPESYAIFGYEAMKVVLLSIQNAGAKGNNRQAVIDAFFHIKNRQSVLGTYSIDQNGDTTLSSYGGNIVKDGKIVFNRVITVHPAS